MTVLLSTAYWPNLQYFIYLLNAEKVFIEKYENYSKQSFRNRTCILSANGPLELSIPVQKTDNKIKIAELLINYKENWQAKHWRALVSAYKNSPYFEFFEDEIQTFYTQRFEHLLTYNQKQIDLILKLLKLRVETKFTESYAKAHGYVDLREKIHPKIDPSGDKFTKDILRKPYYQTFENKFEFVPNLSILDLLFNKGLQSIEHLKVPTHLLSS